MEYILYGAGTNAKRLYAFVYSKGKEEAIDCFCDKKFKEIRRVGELDCVGYEEAKKKKLPFVITIDENNSRVHDEIVSALLSDNVECISSIKAWFMELFGEEGQLYYDEFIEQKLKLTIEYSKIRRILEYNQICEKSQYLDAKYIWFMPEFGFLNLVFESVRNESNVFVVDSWEKCLYIIQVLDFTTVHYFVFFQPWVSRLIDVLELLKKRFTKSSFVYYSYDTEVFRETDDAKRYYLFDKLFIYDEQEAKIRGISYYPGLYDKPSIYRNDIPKEYDIVWSGFPHGRLQKLIEVYDAAQKSGISCRFIVIDDGTIKKVERDGIEYVDKLEPVDSIKLTMSGRCSLDLMHNDDTALTIRVYEAVVCGMKVLTDNAQIMGFKYYDETMMKCFENIEEIDFSYISQEGNGYQYEGEFSTISFLKYFECMG